MDRNALAIPMAAFGAVLAAACLTTGVARATPVAFGGNAYEFVSVADPFSGSNNTLATASAAAAASVFNGVNGHLATVTSLAENDFLLSLIATAPTGFNGAWLGGDFQGWLEGPETGKTFAEVGGFTNFNPLEPNNNGPLYMSIGDTTPNSGSGGRGRWLDDSGALGTPDSSLDPVIGYFVEYEDAITAATEPSSIALLLGGATILAVIRRRRASRA
jgi:hypothetical protein